MNLPERSAALDTNLLLLYLVSRDNRLLHLIGTWKRLSNFARADALRLEKLVAGFRLRVTTPHVLTETSNFIGQLAEPHKGVLLQAFRRFIDMAEERMLPASALTQNRVFTKLRLTDCALLELPPSCAVLTIDFHLAAERQRSGGQVVNFLASTSR